MKKNILVFVLGLFAFTAFAQTVSESTIKKVSLGYDLYNTFWIDMPNDAVGNSVDTRLVNQGVNVFAMYNHELNEKGLSVAAGLGISSENLFLSSNHYVANTHPTIETDVVSFETLPEGITFTRNKLNFTYLDIPLELRLKTDKDLRFGLGFKFGILLDSKTFYKGDAFNDEGANLGYVEISKDKKINQLEEYRFGVQLRAGYKWVQAFGYYSLNKVFIADKGPQMYPIHVGVTFMPF
jgi:hypothetical protein